MGAFFKSISAINILELAVVVVILAAMFVFFAKKKSFKLLFIYLIIFLLYLLIMVLDGIYSLPIAKGVISFVVIFVMILLVSVYSSEFKVMFFNLTKNAEKSTHSELKLSDEELISAADEIIKACQAMSKSRTGALIVIATSAVPPNILETGTELDALVSAPLLESIFNTKAPIHDGAIIIKGNRILGAGCFLPLSQNQTIAKTLGTRHRAGIGITEETDMKTIIVSEETGVISIAERGALRRFVTPDRLRDIVKDIFGVKETNSTANKHIRKL